MTAYSSRVDDPTGSDVTALLEQHLAEMSSHTPTESVHALPVAALAHPDVTFLSVWSGDALAGVGALKQLDPSHAEIKSMRVADAFRGLGVGAVILAFILDEARARGFAQVSLETGTNPPFEAARRLYTKHGFTECEPFADYRLDPWSIYMTRSITAE